MNAEAGDLYLRLRMSNSSKQVFKYTEHSAKELGGVQ